jgi:tetratricopeptide (TPR) repeat protein
MQTRKQKIEQLNKAIDVLWHGVKDTKDGDYPRIIFLYKEMLKLDPKNSDAWENMIWLMWSLSINKKDTAWMIEAEKFVKMYLSVMPNGYRAYEYIGMFYRTMVKDERLAIRYYESAIRWKDAPESTHHSLVSLCAKRNDKRLAIGYCKLTLTRFPKDAWAISKLKELTKN